jgi:hypothetical protein
VLWNTPEGYLSLLSEYCPGTTLLDMLKYTNTLPELFIAKMTTGIIKVKLIFYLTFNLLIYQTILQLIIFRHLN